MGRKLALEEQYEMLCDREDQGENVSAADRIRGGYYRTKSMRSGDLLEVMAYPMPGMKAERSVRRMRPTSDAMKALNEKNAQRRMIRLVETNFGETDFYFTGTIEGNLPTVGEAAAIMKAFIRRWKRARVKQGLTSHKYIYVIEGHEEGDRKRRVHLHAILEGGLDRREVKRLWDRGRSRCDELDKGGNGGLVPLARYLCKDPRGKRRWSESKGLKQPKVTVAERKVSARTVGKLAGDVLGRAAALERLYPDYRLVDCEVKSNPYVAGCWVYAVMRRGNDADHGNGRPAHRGGRAKMADRVGRIGAGESS